MRPFRCTPFSPSALAVAALIAASPASLSASAMPSELTSMLSTLATQWGGDPTIVAAVQAQNAGGMSMNEVLTLDERWQQAASVQPFMQPYLENDTAAALRALEEAAGFVVESFAMDRQGGLVGTTQRTSDYWQGDEAKFTESFMDGQGAIHTGEIEYDASAESFLVQVSVPVIDGGAAIGAITLGIDLDHWN